MQSEQFTSLVNKAIKGDKEAFTELCLLKGRHVLYLCIRLMKNTADGNDAAQEVFIQMQKGIGNLHSPEAFSVWVNKIIQCTCLRMKRKTMRESEMLLPGKDADIVPEQELDFIPQAYTENAEKRAQLLCAVGELAYKQRACILLFYYEEMDYAKIAEVLGISPKTVSIHLQRAKQNLRKKLDAQSAPGGPLVPIAILTRLYREDAARFITDKAVRTSLQKAGILLVAFTHRPLLRAASRVLQVLAVAVGGLLAAFAIANMVYPSSAEAAPAPPAGFPQGGSAAHTPASAFAAAANPLSVASSGAGVPQRPAPGGSSYPSGRQAPPLALPAAEGTVPNPAPGPLTAAPGMQVAPAGRVVFVDAAGKPLPTAQHHTEGYLLQLVQGDVVFAYTHSNAAGHYNFGQVALPGPGAYTLRATPQTSGMPVFSPATPGGEVAVQLDEGQPAPQMPPIYVTDATPPEIEFSVTDAHNAPVQQNPARIRIVVNDDTDTTCTWHIEDSEGAHRAAGTQRLVQPQLAPLAPGRYLLSATATDAAGNTRTAIVAFSIT